MNAGMRRKTEERQRQRQRQRKKDKRCKTGKK